MINLKILPFFMCSKILSFLSFFIYLRTLPFFFTYLKVLFKMPPIQSKKRSRSTISDDIK